MIHLLIQQILIFLLPVIYQITILGIGYNNSEQKDKVVAFLELTLYLEEEGYKQINISMYYIL